MYRITQDFWDCWSEGTGVCAWCSNVGTHLDVFPTFNSLIGAPGLNGSSWPDGDMLPFGYIMDPGTPAPVVTRFTPIEQQFVMTLWVINRSPLIFGGDPTRLDSTTTALITNDEALAIQKSSSGNSLVPNTGDFVLYKAQGAGVTYAAVFNPYINATTAHVQVQFSQVGLTGTCSVRDIWALSDLGSFASSFNYTLPFHGAGLFAISNCH